MVRIQRNDAPPRPKVNLVSDDETPLSNSPSTESSSSSSTDSSSSSGGKAQATPSPLSDFIEEDNSPQPPPKSSSSSWEPVKRRRKRIRTLRKKPKFDTVDADDEESTSTTSTSSEGIPTPDVTADANDEEQQHESPSPAPSTPPERRRRRRAAAPRCLLDALNKYVEPMSKQAVDYAKRSMREIWRERSDKEDSDEVPDDSSVEYIPRQSEQSDEEVAENDAEEPTENDNKCSDSSTGGFPIRRRPVRSTDSHHNGPSHAAHSDEKNAAERENPVRLRNKEESRAHHSSRRQGGRRCSLINMSDTDEDIPLKTVLQQKQEALNGRKEAISALPRGKDVKLKNRTAASRQEDETEIIDLCGNEEYVMSSAITIDDEHVHPNTTTIQDPRDCIRRGLKSEEEEQVRARCSFELDGNEDQPVRSRKNTSIIKTEGLHPSWQGNASVDVACEDDAPASTAAGRDVMHEQNARLAASLTHIKNPRRGSHNKRVKENSTEPNVKRELSSQMVKVENDIDRSINSRNEDSADSREHKEQKPNYETGKPGQTSSNQELPCSTGLESNHASLTSQGGRAIHRFHGAKQRGQTLHPDRVHDRVPRSDGERQALLKFVKAEARDIYRSFSAEPPARRFKCASTDVTFVRQVLAVLGKLMGLRVRSELDGAGRRLVLERSPFGTVGGSEREVEEAVEGFYYDALADLTDQSKNNASVPHSLNKDGGKEYQCAKRDEKAKTKRKEEDKSFASPTRSSRPKERSGNQRSWHKDKITHKPQQNKRRRRNDSDHPGASVAYSHTQKRRRYG